MLSFVFPFFFTFCWAKIPFHNPQPRYCMGVGYPVDLVVCVALGVDMFDCVYPCRTARFGMDRPCDQRVRLCS